MFFVQNIEFQYYFFFFWGRGLRKKKLGGGGVQCFVDITFWVITKLDYIKGLFLCIFGSFLKVKVQNEGNFFGVAKISNIFFGVLEIPDIFFFFFLGGGGAER